MAYLIPISYQFSEYKKKFVLSVEVKNAINVVQLLKNNHNTLS